MRVARDGETRDDPIAVDGHEHRGVGMASHRAEVPGWPDFETVEALEMPAAAPSSQGG